VIGGGYWATGIIVAYRADTDSWWATVDFYDDGFIGDDDPAAGIVSTQGTLRTRYPVKGLSAAIDVVKCDAERMGVSFREDGVVGPYVYYLGDGVNDDYPPPDGWRGMVNEQAQRLGWRPMYRDEAADA